MEMVPRRSVTTEEGYLLIPIKRRRFCCSGDNDTVACWGKFNQNSYKISGGLHGVGVSVVNALSETLDLRVWRDDKEHAMRFFDGEPEADLKVIGDAVGKSGTEITFKPSASTFTNTKFDLPD